jgi:hypothetical protein
MPTCECGCTVYSVHCKGYNLIGVTTVEGDTASYDNSSLFTVTYQLIYRHCTCTVLGCWNTSASLTADLGCWQVSTSFVFIVISTPSFQSSHCKKNNGKFSHKIPYFGCCRPQYLGMGENMVVELFPISSGIINTRFLGCISREPFNSTDACLRIHQGYSVFKGKTPICKRLAKTSHPLPFSFKGTDQQGFTVIEGYTNR